MIFTAREAQDAERWNAAGLNAVHAAICASDAVLIAVTGLRSSSQDHRAVIKLLQAEVRDFPSERERQLKGLLGVKNRIAYEQSLLREAESRVLVDQAERFTSWAEEVVRRQD